MGKYVKHILFVIMAFSAFQATCKEKLVFGRVVNASGVGISNASLQAEDRREIFYCNNKGIFSFRVNTDSIEAFWVISLGYEREEVFVDDMGKDSVIIQLKKSNTVLKEAGVSAKAGRMREGIAGSGKSAHGEGCYLTTKDEIALFFKTDSDRNATLREVNVYITKEGAHSSKFLVHVYARDTLTGGPGEELTDTLLALQARRGNEWVSADLSDKWIPVHGGVYVSVEWVPGYGNDYIPWPVNGNNYYSGEDSLKGFYNGQVLGLTWIAGPKPIVYRRYARDVFEKDKKNAGKWYLTPPHSGGHRMGQWITPMIYFSYTYLDR